MSFFVKNLSAQRCMLLYWQCQAEPIFVSSDGKAARAAGLFFVVNGSGSMPVMRQQTGASERRQYSDRQEQVSTSNTTGRSRLAPAIQQPPGTGLLRKPAHCPSVPLKGKRPPHRSVRQTPDIVQYLVQFSH